MRIAWWGISCATAKRLKADLGKRFFTVCHDEEEREGGKAGGRGEGEVSNLPLAQPHSARESEACGWVQN